MFINQYIQQVLSCQIRDTRRTPLCTSATSTSWHHLVWFTLLGSPTAGSLVGGLLARVRAGCEGQTNNDKPVTFTQSNTSIGKITQTHLQASTHFSILSRKTISWRAKDATCAPSTRVWAPPQNTGGGPSTCLNPWGSARNQVSGYTSSILSSIYIEWDTSLPGRYI